MPGESIQITLELEGLPEEQGHLRLTDFLTQLNALRESLNRIDRLVEQSRQANIYYRIVSLSHSSPIKVVLMPVASEGSDVDRGDIQIFHDRFFSELGAISRNEQPSPDIDNSTLRSFQRLVEKEGKSFARGKISNNTASVVLDKALRERVTTLINREYFVFGSLTGELGTINLHGRAKHFWIYPAIGPEKVLCKLLPGVKEKAKKHIEQVVTVRGKKYYRPNSNFPYRIDAQDLEAVSQSGEPIDILSLKGIAPEATGTKTAVEFIRDIRNEWE